MAKENFALLHGWVVAAPKIYVSRETNKPVKAVLRLLTIRRPFLRKGVAVPARFDYPIVWTNNEALIEQVNSIHAGDMVDIRGAYTTRAVQKSSVCECGHENCTNGLKSYITAIYICRREHELKQDDAMELLRQRNEVSNVINIIGYLVHDPDFYQSEDGKQSNAQYQLAANRMLRLNNDDTDYPIVKSYGRQAYEDSQRLKQGSMVYISGSLQTREFEKTVTCEDCGKEYTVKDTTMEIAPYHVEYLHNCDMRKADESGTLIDMNKEEEGQTDE